MVALWPFWSVDSAAQFSDGLYGRNEQLLRGNQWLPFLCRQLAQGVVANVAAAD